MELSDVKWGKVLLNELFDIYTGSDLIISKIKLGNIPVISHSIQNNGVACYSNLINNRKLFSCRNTISLADRGNFKAFVQKEDFYIGTRVKALVSKKDIGYNALMYLTTLIDKQTVKFSYGYNACDNLERLNIMIPVNNNNEPDFDFMNKYIENLLLKEINAAKEYCNRKIIDISIKNIPSLKEKQWEAFSINEIFPFIQRGKRLKKSDHKLGEIPYVSSTMLNNGIDNFIGNKEGKRFNNCITIANSGSVGASFYHQYEFIGSDHITAFKNKQFNKYIYLFLTTVVSRIGDKYSFNREINDFRISNEKILLPINADGNPDYEYMEQYIKNIMYEQYKRYLDFLEY